MRDGTEYEEKVEHPKGEPENKLSQEELYAKFRSLMVIAGKSGRLADEMISVIFKNEDVKLEKLFNLLSE